MEISAELLESIAAKCWHSPSEFARILLPHWFPTKMPPVHRGILALLTGKTEFLLNFGKEDWRDDPNAEWTPNDLGWILREFVEEIGKDPETGKILTRPIFALREESDGSISIEVDTKINIGIIMPRGFSKTTVVNLANLIDLAYKNQDFFLYVSEASGHAERQLGTIKKELEENELVRKIFGDLVAPRQSSNKWTDNYIEPTNGVMVGAVGRGGAIRGFSKGARRPGKITYDDIEDSESVRVDEQRKKDAKWFFSTALPTVRKGGKSVIIGTLLHTDAILNKVMIHPEWTVIRFGAIGRDGLPIWAWMMSAEEIEAKKLAFASVGETPGFYMEYMSEYKHDSAMMFPASKMVYLHKGMELFVGAALAQDPAISKESTADFCTFGVVGIERNGVKHAIDYYGEQGMDPDDQVEKFFELHFKYLCKLPPDVRKHGIEAIGYQRALISIVTGKMFQKSKLFGPDAYFDITPIFHGKIGKLPRVQGILKPLITSGYFTFDQRWPDLETMFTDWPNGKLDGPDVLAMATRLLDPFVALNLPEDEDGTNDLAKDTAPPLSVVLGGKTFRSAP